MDLTSISAINTIGIKGGTAVTEGTLTGTLSQKSQKAEGTVFDAFLNSAINSINNTNNLLSAAENEEIKFALGEVTNAHDLGIALQKASTALQYTVAVRDKFLEAYREIMQMQI